MGSSESSPLDERSAPLAPVPAALARLHAEDPLAVAAAARWLGERLRAGEVEIDAVVEVADALVPLARHASPRVRQSAAEVAAYLPEAAYQAVVPALAKDRSPYVRDAAERTIERRASMRRAQASAEEHDARVEKWYRELGGPGARAIARRIAAHETEYFVRRMCHEAESSFLAYSETMRRLREALDAPALERASLRAMVERVDERFRFFQHVLQTGRSRARPAEAQLRREDLAAIALDEAELVAARFPALARRLAVDVSEIERPLVIDGDAGFLREALGNILKNAVESYGAGHTGTVRVALAARAEASDAILTVRDWGMGMTEHDVARAFVPFESSKPGGTGFGLFIARRVAVAVHGGELRLTSAPGEGTTVTMTLPLRQERARPRRGSRR